MQGCLCVYRFTHVGSVSQSVNQYVTPVRPHHYHGGNLLFFLSCPVPSSRAHHIGWATYRPVLVHVGSVSQSVNHDGTPV